MRRRGRLISVGMGLLLLACGQVATGTQFNNAGFSRKMPIRFAGYTQSGTLTNFPALVQFAEGSNGFSYANMGSPNSGADLRFTDSAGTNELNYEIETWTNGGTSYVWVQVPQLADTNTSIYAWYGNAAATAPAYTTNGATWDGNFKAVWHMSETSGGVRDSTINANHGTASAGISQGVAGMVGGADYFNGSSIISAAHSASLEITGPWTVSCWTYFSQVPPPVGSSGYSYPNLIGKFGGGGVNGYGMFWYYTKGLEAIIGPGGAGWVESPKVTPDPTASVWYHYQGVYDGAKLRMYVNGVEQGTGTTSANPQPTSPDPVIMGRHYGDGAAYGYFKGSLDEGRISNVGRSPAWIWAEWKNLRRCRDCRHANCRR